MVGRNLKGYEQCRNDSSPQVFTAICQYHTGYGGRNISQRHELPNVSGGYNYKEIRRKSPYHGSQCRHPSLEIESAKQDIKA